MGNTGTPDTHVSLSRIHMVGPRGSVTCHDVSDVRCQTCDGDLLPAASAQDTRAARDRVVCGVRARSAGPYADAERRVAQG
eukprot:scaffold20396_cov101-Isochrysis_galbana.AAC.5